MLQSLQLANWIPIQTPLNPSNIDRTPVRKSLTCPDMSHPPLEPVEPTSGMMLESTVCQYGVGRKERVEASSYSLFRSFSYHSRAAHSIL